MTIVLFATWLALAGAVTLASVGSGLMVTLITHHLFSGIMFRHAAPEPSTVESSTTGSKMLGASVAESNMRGSSMPGSTLTLRLGGCFIRFLRLGCASVWYVFVVLHAGARVALCALSPGHRIRPGIIKVPTTLRTEFGMAVLANLITLTPGTFVMDYDPSDKCFFVHVLWTGPGANAETLRMISGLESWVRQVVE